MQRPRTRGECADGPRPCPWAGCRHHLILDINPRTGFIKLNFSSIEAMEETCSLDVAERAAAQGRPLDLQTIGALLGRTGESARLSEVDALAALGQVL